MVCVLTRLRVADNSGVRMVQCIKLLGGSFSRRALPGKLVVVVVKQVDLLKSKFQAGMVLRALVVRTTVVFFRGYGIWLRFSENAVILTNKRAAPYGKRLRGPFLKEICIKYNLCGTVTRFII